MSSPIPATKDLRWRIMRQSKRKITRVYPLKKTHCEYCKRLFDYHRINPEPNLCPLCCLKLGLSFRAPHKPAAKKLLNFIRSDRCFICERHLSSKHYLSKDNFRICQLCSEHKLEGWMKLFFPRDNDLELPRNINYWFSDDDEQTLQIMFDYMGSKGKKGLGLQLTFDLNSDMAPPIRTDHDNNKKSNRPFRVAILLSFS